MQSSRQCRGAIKGEDGQMVVTTVSEYTSPLAFSIQGYHQRMKFTLADLDDDYDVYLGMKCLIEHEPRVHWGKREVEIPIPGAHRRSVTIKSQIQTSIRTLSSREFKREVRKGRVQEVYLCRLEMVEPVLAPMPMTLEVEPPGEARVAAAIREETEKEVPEGETAEEKAEREKDETLHMGWSKVISDLSTRVVGEYQDIFCDEIPKLPLKRSVEFAINLEPGHPPPARPPYRLSFGELDEMRRQLDDLLAKGFIRPSVSPFAAPAFFVAKKDGSLRMCIDYRAINKITIKDKYAMPRPEELLDRLHGAKIFSVLDMRQFFYQLRIRLGDEPKTAMCIWYGNYEWLVMPFGICNPPLTSQQAIQVCLREVLDDCVFAWIDDVLVYSPTVDQHEEDLRRVLGCLRKDEYYVKISKCKFFVPKVVYIGLEILDVGVRAEPKKAELIQTWPKPENKHELRISLGLCN
uniref:Reverse transcriptase domain-containing protein n=1 Tax=Chromera velia CCMP2878 TaxID=1169474 RepID=A0A0G4G628_9ALVE|eukprot:Cvel_20416.t1-p1 / transcript=Cvel_20416.t1 / gene=Cvel_20416 / organism=Chromera_velia_CCMP2878 / gene_product=Retrotransposable element Tf2 155 kDa protein type, putative / transcript_product=Retrotransposable element Tf2 155 kDa protein type, putative / location=Cvel_scaffold1829:3601-4986(+) / protein_length=462 / sequence_SO=supercontig / SO=protein_coding / is_pseudo=false